MPQMTVDESIAQGRQYCQAGRFDEAKNLFREVLAKNPNQFDALHLLGVIALQSKDYDGAEALIGRAISANPRVAEAHYHLGNVLAAKGMLDAGASSYRRAIEIDPRLIEASVNLANTLKRQGKLDEAIGVYRRAIAFRPDSAEAYCNLGNVLKKQGRHDEALTAHRKAVEIRPDFAQAIYNLANGLREQGSVDEAKANYLRAIQLRPDLMEGYNNLANVHKDCGQLDEAIACYDKAIVHAPRDPARHSNRLYAMLFHPGFGPQSLYDAHREFNRRHADPLKEFIHPHQNSRDPQRRLRVGYVSPNFCDHVVGRNILPLFQRHNRDELQIYCYADEVKSDGFTEKFRLSADGWRNILGLSHERVAELIRADKIDILVDLTLHMADNRLMVFARKPAPVQVTFAGYPGSTGLDAIDYRLTDPHLDPPGAGDHLYAEKSIRLPDTFWCYDPAAANVGLQPEPSVAPAPAVASGFVTFGCLNNFCKVNPQVLALWARVLQAAGNSRLILMAFEGDHRRRTIERFASHGIDPSRIEFVLNRPRDEYLRYYHRIDIGLDTAPYNGHTTSLDSYWMGVPVITRVGQTVVGRAGLSQLTNLGLTELAAGDDEQFVEIARTVAADISRLSDMRAGLRERLRRSPLMDAPRFAKNIESEYREMWRKWCMAG